MAKSEVGTLNVEIVARLEKLEAALLKAEGAVKKSAKRMDESIGKVGGSLKKLNAISAAAATVGAVILAARSAAAGLESVLFGVQHVMALIEGDAERIKSTFDKLKNTVKDIPAVGDSFIAGTKIGDAMVRGIASLQRMFPILRKFQQHIPDFVPGDDARIRGEQQDAFNKAGLDRAGKLGPFLSSLRDQASLSGLTGRDRRAAGLEIMREKQLLRLEKLFGDDSRFTNQFNEGTKLINQSIDNQIASLAPDKKAGASGPGILGKRFTEGKNTEQKQLSVLERIEKNTRVGAVVS